MVVTILEPGLLQNSVRGPRWCPHWSPQATVCPLDARSERGPGPGQQLPGSGCAWAGVCASRRLLVQAEWVALRGARERPSSRPKVRKVIHKELLLTWPSLLRPFSPSSRRSSPSQQEAPRPDPQSGAGQAKMPPWAAQGTKADMLTWQVPRDED